MGLRLLALFLFLCSILLVAAGEPVGAQVGQWQSIGYEKWGFSVQIPGPVEKQSPIDQPRDGLTEAYVSHGLACVVKVVPVSPNLLTSTAIEQAIQTEMKLSAKLGTVRRWEQESKQGELFKGFIRMIHLDLGNPLYVPLRKILADGTGVECTSMAPLRDESGPILEVSVVGPRDRASEVETVARGIASFVSKTEAKPDASKESDASKVVKPAVKPQQVKPDIKPAIKPVVKPVAKPEPKPAPAPKPRPALKNGEIELNGQVDSIAPDSKSVTMMVDSIKMPGQGSITLSPARSKTVFVKKLPKWVAAGARVVIVGKNTGIGNAMTADIIEAAK